MRDVAVDSTLRTNSNDTNTCIQQMQYFLCVVYEHGSFSFCAAAFREREQLGTSVPTRAARLQRIYMAYARCILEVCAVPR
jgi:hypothetical protein